MVFSSAAFLFAFMPLFFIVYFALPGRKVKNIWLFVTSLVFYAWGEPVYILLMLVSITANWLLALLIDATPKGVHQEASESAQADTRAKVYLVVAIAFDVAVIGFFKYEGFVADNINALAGAPVVPNLLLPLPIGISFYTLQALSYVIDVYRRDVDAQRNLLYLGMYIACFPQLIAGPIVRYSTIQEQVLNRAENLDDFSSGLRLFIVGLAKKALLANVVAVLATEMLDAGGSSIGAVGSWAGLIAYTFQIFFDFSGYSDMAIGLGRMMGFKYLRNFNYPYISKSVTEFWRRWHISLSTFFRDYIYIPLGGSRCSKVRWAFNLAVVWSITGLWHGAAWNYILWGVYYGALLICEKFLFKRFLDMLPTFVQHAYAIVLFLFGWLIFWIPDSGQFFEYLKALFGFYGLTGDYEFWQLDAWEYWPVFLACVVASVPVAPFFKERFCAWAEGRAPRPISSDGVVNPRCIVADTLCVISCKPATAGKAKALGAVQVLLDMLLLGLLVLSAASVVSGSFNPFIYFQF